MSNACDVRSPGRSHFAHRLAPRLQSAVELNPPCLTVGQQPQPAIVGIPNSESFISDRMTTRTSTIVHSPSGGSGARRREDSAEPSNSTFFEVSARSRSSSHCLVDAFLRQDVFNPSDSSSDAKRTGRNSTRRSKPYGTSRARATEHSYTEAGPSTLMLQNTLDVGLPTLHPTGRSIPVITADAPNNQTVAEENKAPVSSFYRPMSFM